MKIIGWAKKGNVIRLALGDDDLKYWEGDDWDNSPYEHNADSIPMFGVKVEIDVAFKFDTSVLEASDDQNYHGNSPFCMNDFKERKVPILVIDKTGNARYYSKCVDKEEVFGIFMGDRFEDINWEELGAISVCYVRGDSLFLKHLKNIASDGAVQGNSENATLVNKMQLFDLEKKYRIVIYEDGTCTRKLAAAEFKYISEIASFCCDYRSFWCNVFDKTSGHNSSIVFEGFCIDYMDEHFKILRKRG